MTDKTDGGPAPLTADEIAAMQADAKPSQIFVDMAGAMDKITPELMEAMAPILLSPMIQALELELQRKEATITAQAAELTTERQAREAQAARIAELEKKP